MDASTAFRQALPAIIPGRGMEGEMPPLGLGEPHALRSGDRLGPDGIPWAFSHEWQPAVLDAVTQACRDAIAAERPWFRMAPVILSGPRGAGRTHAARTLARVADLPHAVLNVSDPVIAANLAASGEVGEALWVTPVVAAIAATRCANPVVSVVGADVADADVVAALVAMIDPVTTGSFREDRLGALVDLGEVTWILQCRAGAELPADLRRLATPLAMTLPNTDPESLLGLSVLYEALADLRVDPDVAGLDWRTIMSSLPERRWWSSVKDLYVDLRSAVVESAYLAAIGETTARGG